MESAYDTLEDRRPEPFVEPYFAIFEARSIRYREIIVDAQIVVRRTSRCIEGFKATRFPRNPQNAAALREKERLERPK